MHPCRIGIVAASSAVPMVELESGAQRLRAEGLDVRIHEQCARQHFTFAGPDAERAAAFFDYAADPAIDVLWCARGGYGATRLLPILEKLAAHHGVPPRKLLVGYSDVTALHEFVRRQWGWRTLHADMPAAANFGRCDVSQWTATMDLVRGNHCDIPLTAPLRWLTPAPGAAIEAPLVGGNLTLWACLAGTPHAPRGAGRMVFFEEVGEAWYRVDRMIVQIEQAGLLEGARAVLLGDFKDCRDERHTCLAAPGGEEKKPLRRCYEEAEALAEIFGGLHRRTGIAIAAGLPAGHGPNFAPLPLGAEYRLEPSGALKLLSWR